MNRREARIALAKGDIISHKDWSGAGVLYRMKKNGALQRKDKSEKKWHFPLDDRFLSKKDDGYLVCHIARKSERFISREKAMIAMAKGKEIGNRDWDNNCKYRLSDSGRLEAWSDSSPQWDSVFTGGSGQYGSGMDEDDGYFICK